MTETLAQKSARLKALREKGNRPLTAKDWQVAQADWKRQGIELTDLDYKIIGHLLPKDI
jgi:hypothetical protein